ncbi:HsdR family type I site-specific deoxyribonuclease [uncultured Sphaerochaeta sp.]|uniref:type I restriction endonuclease subunit R n=1 Tax=uncultured Sphaerochaeta sp. TaxID=886478 RepID=UPI002A0A12B3|nr:HsdR family type I site-specific deoxyribonuclease [uncultured Sphaerochaeta sp.]
MNQTTSVFTKESEFEKALIEELSRKGWEQQVIKNPTEKDLVENWKEILNNNNMIRDRLNGHPLTDGEMQQILEQVIALRTPLKLNGFINGKTVSIKRDNPKDTEHFGKEISLKIYDRNEIAAGQSRYQIVQQPKFTSREAIANDRRGDLMLLINGMPVIHIELKRSGISVSQAYNQIEKYAYEGIFSGLFSLIQVFVAMEPNEAVYFANPGPEGKFVKDYYFHWADFNNIPINGWQDIVSALLSIPMAHQLIGFYTVADGSDGILKVMRSYQYYASSAISDRVSKALWDGGEMRGGYIWHTTGSGKTMTSFKSAQLIANSKDADKVVFLMDRIELGTQSLKEYRGFANETEDVQATEDTYVLISRLKSSNPADTLIVTSIQKMSRINDDGLGARDLAKINSKRMVFIVDEAHRSTFGEMLLTIKKTFPRAMFFGFTGTPILEENQKKKSTTSTVFGDELHRYSIADGIRDRNVLGFDPYKVLTFRDKDLRKAVALEKAKADSVEEAIMDPKKSRIYYRFMNEVPMAGYVGEDGAEVWGNEDYIPTPQYLSPEHQQMVVKDIIENWPTLSRGGKFHAIFATSSIHEAIIYYRLLKSEKPDLRVTCLFDPGIDNNGGVEFKEDGLIEIVTDYNARYGQDFTLSNYDKFKKDIANRLAHKDPYQQIHRTPEKQIDILIVVDQMLTGFDSKWLNTLYLDKLLQYENIIQAFSRTNRIFGPDKPFGMIRYYRKPHTMEKNIEKAVKLYSGDRPFDLFVEKLDKNLENLNLIYAEITDLFTQAGIPDREKLPADNSEKGKFASLFKDLNDYLEAARVQGFVWEKTNYSFGEGEEKKTIVISFEENEYLILAQRYKELFSDSDGKSETPDEVPFAIDGNLTEIDTGRIDREYMDSRFEKYLKALNLGDEEEKQKTLDELHKSFAALTQEEQKYAALFLHDIQRGSVAIEAGKTFKDYVIEYQARIKNDQIHKLASVFGMDEEKLRGFMKFRATPSNLNEYGRFDDLVSTVDRTKAKAFLEDFEKTKLKEYKVTIKIDKFLRDFIIKGGFDV